VGAGAATGITMDVSNMLKPALQMGEIRCIGATTHEDFRRSMESDKALIRRFQKIDIVESTVDETIKIL
jgi:ATP-dependent Clp protease ATP-binding subunit ClpA